MKTITRSARLSMRTKISIALGAAHSLLVTVRGTRMHNAARTLFVMASLFVLLSLSPANASAQGANDRYYRFEEGTAGNAAAGVGSIVDSTWGLPDGTPSGGPIYSSDVAMGLIPLTGASNTLSLSFNGGQSVLFNSFFLLHRGLGDATLEFFQKGPNNHNEDIFWTRPTTDPDANRFNIFNYSGQFWVDYREPDGTLHEAIPTPITSNVWTHIAVVKDTVSAAPSHQYRIYLDGILRTTTNFPSSSTEPDPYQQWTISGRSGYTFTGLIDEVRLSQRALSPCEFLIAYGYGCANNPPVAIDDFYGVDQFAALNEPAPGVLVNDSDPDAGNTLTAVLVTGPSHAASFQLNSDGSFSYVPLANYNGPDTFTYRASDGTLSSQTATVNITVRQNCSQGGFITGGGEFLQDGRRRTFGFVAKVQGNGVQGHLEFQDHGGSMNVRSQNMQMVYAANSSDGYFSGACKVNGAQGYTFFVQVHDRGQPGSNDDFSVWIYDLFGAQVYTSGGLLSGGNIRIHETAAAAVTNVEWMCDNDGDHTWVPSGFSCTAPAGNCVILDGNIPPSGYDRDDNDPSVQ